jgi:hypothetical protein
LYPGAPFLLALADLRNQNERRTVFQVWDPLTILPRRQIMSKIAAMAVCAALAMTILSACGRSTPTGTAQNLIRSLEDQDRTGLKHAYCESSLAELSSRNGPRIRFQDMAYVEHEKQGSTVEVEVQGTVKSGDAVIRITWQLKMKRMGGTWCVDSLQRVGNA